MSAALRQTQSTAIDLRVIVHALISKHRNGCQWRMRPADFPPISAVRSYFDKWKHDGTFVEVNDALRKQARKALGRDEEPSISVLDSQSAKTTEADGEHGYDGKKRYTGASVSSGLIRTVSYYESRFTPPIVQTLKGLNG